MTDRTMPPVGPEMDALVGEILGWLAEEFAHPSTYAYDAWCALDEWREQHPGWTANIAFPDDEEPDYWVRLWDYVTPGPVFGAGNESLSVAICHAIILATREATP